MQQEFITEKEFDELQEAEDFCGWFAIICTKLPNANAKTVFYLFDYQRLIAERIGYRDNSHPNACSWAVYARLLPLCHVKLNIVWNAHPALLWNVDWGALTDEQRPMHKVINERFKLVDDRIRQWRIRGCFAQHPTAILEMFLLMGQQNIRHIRTRTLWILKIVARGIDEHFQWSRQ